MTERLTGEAARDAAIDHIMDTRGLGYDDAAHLADAEDGFDADPTHEGVPERERAVLLGQKAVGGDFLTPDNWKGGRVGPRPGEEEHTGYGPEGKYPDFGPLSDEQKVVNARGRAQVNAVLERIQARIAEKKRHQ